MSGNGDRPAEGGSPTDPADCDDGEETPSTSPPERGDDATGGDGGVTAGDDDRGGAGRQTDGHAEQRETLTGSQDGSGPHDTPDPDGPHARPTRKGSDGRRAIQSFPRRLWTAREGPLAVVRESAVSVGIVALIGLVLFAASGVWPPMVAVESGSMEPHMHRGDLVFITAPGRFVPDGTRGETGVVTRSVGRDVDYRTFGGYGSVVVYDDPARAGPPVIHRAHFWVDAGENWYDRANPSHLQGENCSAVPNCPAPHAGFVTKGDANGLYDQVNGISPGGPTKPGWIVGNARFRVPYLGYIRLWLSEAGMVGVTATAAPTAG